MRNIDGPTRIVSFEDALRNLAAKLTGTPLPPCPAPRRGLCSTWPSASPP